MKVDKIQAVFQSPELLEVLIGPQKDGEKVKDVSESEFAPRLFKSPQKEKLIPVYLQAITAFLGTKKGQKKKKDYVRLLEKFDKEMNRQGDVSSAIKEIAEKTFKPYEDEILARKVKKEKIDISKELAVDGKEEKKEKSEIQALISESGSTDYSKFPEARCKLSELRALSQKVDLIEDQLKEIKKRRKEKDLSLLSKPKTARNEGQNRKRAKHTFPWDENRTGRDIPNFFINASDIVLKGYQNFIFAGCPKDAVEIGDYFDAYLKQGVQLIVTVNKEGEKGHTPAFWSDEWLSQIRLRDGGKIAVVGRKDLAKSDEPVYVSWVDPSSMTAEERATWVPRVQESELRFQKEDKAHTFTHLYYDNWHDHKGPPCLKLLDLLADRIDELNKSREVPIAINCHGGVGRTGTIALILYGRRYIDAELAKGKKLDEIMINIPELLYDLCKQRHGMVGNHGQLPAVYASLASYYEKLKARELQAIAPLD